MKYTIVVDSVAAIPQFVFKSRPIKLLPIQLNIDGVLQADYLDEKDLIDIYTNKGFSIKTAPPTLEQIHQFILKEVTPHNDFAICQSLSRIASPVFDNFEKVGTKIAKDASSLRAELGIEHPFMLTYLNSGTTVAGQGLVALYADMLLTRGTEIQQYTKTIAKFSQRVRNYVIVQDILYSRKRAIERDIKTVGFGSALVGKTVG